MASSQFHPIDAKLFAWTELYEKLKVAQKKLKEAKSRSGEDTTGLREEVTGLDRQCLAALHELNAEYARTRGPPQP